MTAKPIPKPKPTIHQRLFKLEQANEKPIVAPFDELMTERLMRWKRFRRMLRVDNQ